MRRYGIRSGILTILNFRRSKLETKEAVKQIHLKSRKEQLKKENGKNVRIDRIISEDLDLFYTSLPKVRISIYPESQPKEELVDIFSTNKLTEEELVLLESRNKDYLDTFDYYESDKSSLFTRDMEKIEKSSDLESIFSYSCGQRDTLTLHVTFESIKEEMLKRIANEDLSDMELNKQWVKWLSKSGQNQLRFKRVKKE